MIKDIHFFTIPHLTNQTFFCNIQSCINLIQKHYTQSFLQQSRERNQWYYGHLKIRRLRAKMVGDTHRDAGWLISSCPISRPVVYGYTTYLAPFHHQLLPRSV